MIAHAPIATTRTQGRPQRLRYAETIRSAHEHRSHRPTPDDRSETWLRDEMGESLVGDIAILAA